MTEITTATPITVAAIRFLTVVYEVGSAMSDQARTP